MKEVGEEDDLYVHSASQLTTPRVPPPATFRVHTTKNSRFPPRPEVHVTTDHIVMEDFECVCGLFCFRFRLGRVADSLLARSCSPSPSSVNDKAPSLTGTDDNKSCNAV